MEQTLMGTPSSNAPGYGASSAPQGAPDGGEKSSSSSLVVGIVVVIVLAILAGLYFWGAELEEEGMVDTRTGEDAAGIVEENTDAEASDMQNQDAADSAADVGVDMEAEADATGEFEVR